MKHVLILIFIGGLLPWTALGQNKKISELPVVSTFSLTNNIPLIVNTSSTGTVSVTGTTFKTVLGVPTTPASVLFASGTPIDVQNTTTETAIWTNSIAGGTLGSNRGIRINLRGDVLNNTGGSSNFTVRVYYGSTKMFDDNTLALTASATRRLVSLDIRLANLEVTNSQYLSGQLLVNGVNGATTGGGDITQGAFINVGLLEGTAAIDSTAAQGLGITIQPQQPSANLSFRIKYAVAVLE